MPNSNPQAVAFANNRARVMADQMMTAYRSAKAFVQQWTGQGLAAVIPNDANVMVDGSLTDGRQPITNAQINILFAHCQNLIAYFEGATGAPTNNLSMQNHNQCLAIATNGVPKF